MKRIYLFMLVFLTSLSFNTALHAQIAPAPSASVEVFALDPQGGVHNYFGVRVTLNQTYSQDVTATGYIYDEGGGSNTNHPFSVTVTTGNLSNETSSTFYETDATAAATIDISTLTTLTYYTNPYDYIGAQHNAVLDFAYANMVIPASDEDDIFDIVQAYYTTLEIDTVSAFFNATKGTIHEFQNTTNICSTFLTKGMSSDFNTYYNSIDALLDGATTPDEFYLSMRTLEDEISASALSSTEKALLLSSSAVYRYSVSYWSASGRIEDWITKSGLSAFQKAPKNPFKVQESGPYSTSDVTISNNPYFFSWHSVATADGHGAIQGGVAGIGGGIGGVIAGGVLWGAGCSVDNVLTQI